MKEIENLDYKIKSNIEIVLSICDDYSLDDLKMKLFKNQGDYYVSKFKYEKAIESYQKALKIFQNKETELSLYFLNRLGACYYELGDLTLAIKNYTISENLLLTKFAEEERQNIDKNILGKLYYGQAVTHNKLYEYELSIAYIDKLLNISNVDEKIYINAKMLLGNIYFRTNKIKDAIDIYEELDKLYPNNYSIQINLTMLYDAIGEKELSKQIFKSIVSTSDRNLNFAVMDLLNRKNI